MRQQREAENVRLQQLRDQQRIRDLEREREIQQSIEKARRENSHSHSRVYNEPYADARNESYSPLRPNRSISPHMAENPVQSRSRERNSNVDLSNVVENVRGSPLRQSPNRSDRELSPHLQTFYKYQERMRKSQERIQAILGINSQQYASKLPT